MNVVIFSVPFSFHKLTYENCEISGNCPTETRKTQQTGKSEAEWKAFYFPSISYFPVARMHSKPFFFFSFFLFWFILKVTQWLIIIYLVVVLFSFLLWIHLEIVFFCWVLSLVVSSSAPSFVFNVFLCCLIYICSVVKMVSIMLSSIPWNFVIVNGTNVIWFGKCV